MVVGLGNPGRQYEKTRHNVGFEVLDEVARRSGATFRRTWFVPAKTARASVEGQDLLLVKPLTYMTRSGHAVAALLRRRGWGAGDVVVILDDADLEKGKIRVRRKGSAGGHKGLMSIAEALGTEEFVRVRVGIGPRPRGEEMVDHVLSAFTAAERKLVAEAVGKAADAVASLVRQGPDRTMTDFN
jgi:PTH1 family peptidyl-tRNA hydrolase